MTGAVSLALGASALVTVSFDYRTSGTGRFVVDLGVTKHHQQRRTRPGEFSAPASHTRSSSTLLFATRGLPPGTYQVALGANVSAHHRGLAAVHL